VQRAPSESVAVTVKIVVPAVVGVPEITPEELSVRPSGKESVVEKVRGPVPKEQTNVWE
jgi:hypothetical protein